MAAERTTIELQKINEFVSQLDGLVDITSAIVYGVDADGNSVKLTVRQLTDNKRSIAEQVKCRTHAHDV